MDIAALNYAFMCVLRKHEILGYHVLKYYPVQYLQSGISLQVIEKDLQDCPHNSKKKNYIVRFIT